MDWYALDEDGKTPIRLDIDYNRMDEPEMRDRLKRAMDWRKKRVGLDDVGGIRVSTVFLGLDHGYGYGPLVLWETMLFNILEDDNVNFTEEYCERYTSYDAALARHQEIVQILKDGGKVEYPNE